ncbi:hypothetical protein JCM10213_007889 [Rhodosporidiobolus nylandii]
MASIGEFDLPHVATDDERATMATIKAREEEEQMERAADTIISTANPFKGKVRRAPAEIKQPVKHLGELPSKDYSTD